MAQSGMNVNRMEVKEKHEFREVEVATNSHKQKQGVGRYCNNVAGVSNKHMRCNRYSNVKTG